MRSASHETGDVAISMNGGNFSLECGGDVRKMRMALGLTVHDFAKLLCVPAGTLGSWEARQKLSKRGKQILTSFAGRNPQLMHDVAMLQNIAMKHHASPNLRWLSDVDGTTLHGARESLVMDATNSTDSEIQQKIQRAVTWFVENAPPSFSGDVSMQDEVHDWLKSEASKLDFLDGTPIPQDDELESLQNAKQRDSYQAIGEEMYVAELWERRSQFSDGTFDITISVIGIGGSGNRAALDLKKESFARVKFITADTNSISDPCFTKIQRIPDLKLGPQITMGQGTGADPEVGREAAQEVLECLDKVTTGAMVFIVAGMGGGTGTGAAPVVAKLARAKGILTVAVVTTPFSFEGSRRMRVALKGIEELRQHCDSIITIPNEKLIATLGSKATLTEALQASTDAIKSAVLGIVGLIARPGPMSASFADVRATISDMAEATIGVGEASGSDRARTAASHAINDPLLGSAGQSNVHRVLVNITAEDGLSIQEYYDVAKEIEKAVSDTTMIKIATSLDPKMIDATRVTIIRSASSKNGGTDSTEGDMSSQDIPSFLHRLI